MRGEMRAYTRDVRQGHASVAWVAGQANREGTLSGLVGFQTRLKYGEQKRVFGMIPGLEKAEFVRYGQLHRNFYLDTPRTCARDFSLRARPDSLKLHPREPRNPHTLEIPIGENEK